MVVFSKYFDKSVKEWSTTFSGSNHELRGGTFDDKNRPKDVHFGVKCKGCYTKPIRGVRYACLTCSDYDLCGKCKGRNIHKEHEMEEKTMKRGK